MNRLLSFLFYEGKGKHSGLSLDEAAEILSLSPEKLQEFEHRYSILMESAGNKELFFQTSAKQAKEMIDESQPCNSLENLIDRIVDELLSGLQVISVTDGNAETTSYPEQEGEFVTGADLQMIPEESRPQLTGTMIKKELGEPVYPMLLWLWREYKKESEPLKKEQCYNLFRQGLDIQDLDSVIYAMLGMNPNTMSNWLVPLAEANSKHKFFKIPDTTIIKVPLPILQLTRLDYCTLNGTTRNIVDQFCMRAFGLYENREYFVKTGTFSSKFDFRNAHVYGSKEVRELGEYLLYIQNQACLMAGPLTQPCIYGVSTTNEWVVREYISDVENSPCIYKGMPLRCEYRLFVDFDTDSVLGMSPYWEPVTMKNRFAQQDTIHESHDYIVYTMHEKKLMETYESTKCLIREKVQELIPDVNLAGQWSLDIMKNGDEFYLIDMALAANSALKECIPARKLKTLEENWIPTLFK